MKAYSAKEIITLLKKNGWSLERIEGSHHIFTNPNFEEVISIPVHSGKSLKKGLLHAILKAAGLNIIIGL